MNRLFSFKFSDWGGGGDTIVVVVVICVFLFRVDQVLRSVEVLKEET